MKKAHDHFVKLTNIDWPLRAVGLKFGALAEAKHKGWGIFHRWNMSTHSPTRSLKVRAMKKWSWIKKKNELPVHKSGIVELPDTELPIPISDESGIEKLRSELTNQEKRQAHYPAWFLEKIM